MQKETGTVYMGTWALYVAEKGACIAYPNHLTESILRDLISK